MKRIIAVFLSALMIGLSIPYESIASSTGNNDSSFIAATGGDWHSLGLRRDGTVAAVGNNTYGQSNVSSWSGIVGLTASKSLSIGLKSDGTAVVAGVDEHGQGDVSGWTDLVQIETGIDHTVGLKSNGTVVCVGDNEYGQCDTSSWKGIIAIAAGGFHTVGLMKDGSVVACGDNSYMQCNIAKWSDISSIAAGEYHTAAMKRDGTAVAIGYNEDGRCDVRDWRGLTAITAGGYHTIGLKQDGTVVAVGHRSDSRCDVEAWKDIKAIGAGRYHSIGITKAGRVLATGFNNDGQCDVDDWARASGPVDTHVTEQAGPSPSPKEPEAILPENKPTDLNSDGTHERDAANCQPFISAGANQTVGIKPDGTVVAAGLNNYGQCNVGDWSDIVAVDTDYAHTVGLRQDGTAVGVGYNMQKQCDVGNWRNIIAIATGASYTVGLKEDGTVLSTGPSYQNGCDVEDWRDIVAISACKERTIGLRKDGTAVITGFLHENEIAEIPGWTDIISVATGHFHSVGKKSDGTVIAAGINNDGQCEVSGWTDIIAIAADVNHTVGLRKDGTVVATGRNDHGQCNVQDWSGIIAVSAGQMHTVGLREDGSVVATGNNGSGQCKVENWQLMSGLQAEGSLGLVSESDLAVTQHPQASSKTTQNLPRVYVQSVTIPDYPLPYIVSQNVTTLAVQQYIRARFYLDALLEMELNAGTEAEFSSLLGETIAQFALADEYAEQALLAADLAQIYLQSELPASRVAFAADETARIVLPGYRIASNGVPGAPRNRPLAAENSEALKEWAEDITSKFDAVKGNQRCKALGEQLGVDAREAYNQLLAAQAIIKQGADADAAFYDTAVKALMVVKTTCKVAVFAGATFATGGASTLLEGAALVVSGSSAIIEVAATTSTIVLGENNGLTLIYKQIQDAMAPVEAVLGLLTFDFSKAAKLSTKTDEAGAALLGAVDYVGNGLRDFFQDGKIMGLETKELALGAKMTGAVMVEVADLLASDTGTEKEKIDLISDALESACMEGIADVIDATASGMSTAAGAAAQPIPPLESAITFVPTVPIEEVKQAVQQAILNSDLDLGNFDFGLTNKDLTGTYSINGIVDEKQGIGKLTYFDKTSFEYLKKTYPEHGFFFALAYTLYDTGSLQLDEQGNFSFSGSSPGGEKPLNGPKRFEMKGKIDIKALLEAMSKDYTPWAVGVPIGKASFWYTGNETYKDTFSGGDYEQTTYTETGECELEIKYLPEGNLISLYNNHMDIQRKGKRTISYSGNITVDDYERNDALGVSLYFTIDIVGNTGS